MAFKCGLVQSAHRNFQGINLGIVWGCEGAFSNAGYRQDKFKDPTRQISSDRSKIWLAAWNLSSASLTKKPRNELGSEASEFRRSIGDPAKV
jgi:hypothetical protein